MVSIGLPSFEGTVLRASPSSRLTLKGQENSHGRPVARARPDFYLPAMRLDNPRHDGQPQSGALGFRRAQDRSESATALLFTHALAGVPELHRDMRRSLRAAPQTH